jgi:hypothetical protein
MMSKEPCLSMRSLSQKVGDPAVTNVRPISNQFSHYPRVNQHMEPCYAQSNVFVKPCRLDTRVRAAFLCSSVECLRRRDGQRGSHQKGELT